MNSKLGIHSNCDNIKNMLKLKKKQQEEKIAGYSPKWPWLYYDSDIAVMVFYFCSIGTLTQCFSESLRSYVNAMEKSSWMTVERGHWLGKWEATGDLWMRGWKPDYNGWIQCMGRKQREPVQTTSSRSLAAKAKFKIKWFSHF